MSKKGSLFKTYMIRPVLYKCVTRAALAVTALLLWDRFINTAGRLSLLRDGCLTVGLLFFCLGWFSYLRLDGVTVHHMLEERKKKKPVRKSYTDIVDFADEHIVAYEELSEKERAACSLTAHLICGCFFMIPVFLRFMVSFL